MKKPKDSILKLRKLKQIRRKNLEKNLLDVQLKGQDHYVFIKENGKAQVVFKDVEWIAEHIKTAVIKFNYEDSVQRCIDNIRGIGYGNLIVEANPTNIIPTYTENIPNNINTSEAEYKYAKETYINPYRSRPIPKKKQKKYPTKPRSKNIVKPNKLSSII